MIPLVGVPACLTSALKAPPFAAPMHYLCEISALATALGAGDLICVVTKSPEDEVARNGRRPGKKGPAKEGIDVFPDNLSVFGDFEEAAEGRLADQGIAVRQALSVAHAWREKVPNRSVLIRPYDLVRRWINLDHPRKRHRVIQTMNSVVENENVAVPQQGWRMLAGECGRT
jgi:hypothetical protein